MKNKVCIITGAGGGIGSAIAEVLFNYGFKLVLMGRNEEKLKKTAKTQENIALHKKNYMQTRKWTTGLRCGVGYSGSV